MKHCLSQKHADLNDVSLICVSIFFLSAAGTSFHITKMLVELVLCPLTFKGAADGSDINEERTALNSEIIYTNLFYVP